MVKIWYFKDNNGVLPCEVEVLVANVRAHHNVSNGELDIKDNLWHTIWKLNDPLKLKYFHLRACNNSFLINVV